MLREKTRGTTWVWVSSDGHTDMTDTLPGKYPYMLHISTLTCRSLLGNKHVSFRCWATSPNVTQQACPPPLQCGNTIRKHTACTVSAPDGGATCPLCVCFVFVCLFVFNLHIKEQKEKHKVTDEQRERERDRDPALVFSLAVGRCPPVDKKEDSHFEFVCPVCLWEYDFFKIIMADISLHAALTWKMSGYMWKQKSYEDTGGPPFVLHCVPVIYLLFFCSTYLQWWRKYSDLRLK